VKHAQDKLAVLALSTATSFPFLSLVVACPNRNTPMLRPLELLLSHIHHPAPTSIMCMKPSTSLFFFALCSWFFEVLAENRGALAIS
jgi:hypothetical protein